MKFEKEIVLKDIYDYDGCGNLRFNNEFSCEDIKELYYKMARKKVKLTLEVEEPILDEEERKYLSGVIRPFRDRVKCIKKEKDSNKREYITIVYDDGWLIPLPFFENNIMYKNLELNKEYTLDDLDL